MSKLCFVIAPIGDEGTEVRRRSDQILKYIIEAAAQECGYETLRADKISEPGIITSQIIQHLLEDPLVVADLTGHNPNVFYELAVRHVIRKPVVQLIAKGEQIPFDVAATRTIQVDHHDLESAAKCRQALIGQIKSVEKDAAEVDTPISAAIDLQELRRSGNPMEKSVAELISSLQSLHGKVDVLTEEYIWTTLPEDKKRASLQALPENLTRKEALILSTVGQLDRGDGVKEGDVISAVGRINPNEVKAIMIQHLKEGLLYQPKPGYVRRTSI